MSNLPRVRVPAVMGEVVNQTPVKPEPEYHSASNARRIIGYGRSSSGPNKVLSGSIRTLINRSRHAYRNSPLVKKATDSNVTNEIGTGIITRFQSKDTEFNEAARKAHDVWVNQCSPDGSLGHYGNQRLICLAREMSGDCFVRRRIRPLSSGLLVPMQYQILEAEYVPHELNEIRPNGNRIVQGIELNRYGRRVAYWMHTSHPGEVEGGIQPKLVRIPAKDVIHSYRPTRPGQLRGEPRSSGAILKVKTFEQYDDFELQRKESKSGYTGMLTRNDYEDSDYAFDPFTGKPLYEVEGELEVGLLPGTIMSGLPGESLTLFEGDNTGSGYKDFMREQKLSIAATQNIPFELMTGDWASINDRIYRALINEYRRGVMADQDHLTIFQVERVIKDWFIQSAVFAGVLSPVNYITNIHDYHYAEFRPHAWKHIHPEQDVKAKLLEIEGNLNSTDAVVAESGHDAEEIDRQNVIGELRRKTMREAAGLPSKEEKEKRKPSDEPEELDENE